MLLQSMVKIGDQKSRTKVTLGAERDFDLREGRFQQFWSQDWLLVADRFVARQRWSGEVRICIELQVDFMTAESQVA